MGTDTVGFFIDVSADPQGGLAAEADIPDQGVGDLPLAATSRGDSLFLRLGGSEGTPEWRGRLDPAATGLSGIFTRFGEEYPLDLHRVGEASISSDLQAFLSAPLDSSRLEALSSEGRELQAAFNALADRPRLIVFLSPT